MITEDSLRQLLTREAGCSMESDPDAIEEFVQNTDMEKIQSLHGYQLVQDYQLWVRERADRRAAER